MIGELKQCPFCGGEAFVNDDPTGNGGKPHMSGNVGLGRLWSVECDECGADGGFWQDCAIAIAAWNTRAERKPTDAVREFAERYEKRIAELEGLLAQAERTCKNVCDEWAKTSFAHAETSFCCSECGAHYVDCECYYAALADANEGHIRTNYCPNCGAKVI